MPCRFVNRTADISALSRSLDSEETYISCSVHKGECTYIVKWEIQLTCSPRSRRCICSQVDTERPRLCSYTQGSEAHLKKILILLFFFILHKVAEKLLKLHTGLWGSPKKIINLVIIFILYKVAEKLLKLHFMNFICSL